MICSCGRYISGDFCVICNKIIIQKESDIKSKKKPLKATKTPKEKTCKECKMIFIPSIIGQKVCGVPCAIKLVKKDTEVKELKAWKVRKKELKEKLKTLGEYEQDARKYFQRWIRERDKDLPCISCGRYADRYDAGHWLKAELYSGLIFNEDNCNKQCSRPCNLDLHGNEANYRIGLIKKIGEDRVRWLEENKDALRTYKYSKEELIEIKKKYSKLLKEL